MTSPATSLSCVHNSIMYFSILPKNNLTGWQISQNISFIIHLSQTLKQRHCVMTNPTREASKHHSSDLDKPNDGLVQTSYAALPPKETAWDLRHWMLLLRLQGGLSRSSPCCTHLHKPFKHRRKEWSLKCPLFLSLKSITICQNVCVRYYSEVMMFYVSSTALLHW